MKVVKTLAAHNIGTAVTMITGNIPGIITSVRISNSNRVLYGITYYNKVDGMIATINIPEYLVVRDDDIVLDTINITNGNILTKNKNEYTTIYAYAVNSDVVLKRAVNDRVDLFVNKLVIYDSDKIRYNVLNSVAIDKEDSASWVSYAEDWVDNSEIVKDESHGVMKIVLV